MAWIAVPSTLEKPLDCIFQMKKSDRRLANNLFLKLGDGLSKINDQPKKAKNHIL